MFYFLHSSFNVGTASNTSVLEEAVFWVHSSTAPEFVSFPPLRDTEVHQKNML